VTAAPKNIELQLLAGRLYADAFGDLAAAEATAKRALAADPNNLAAFTLMARVYFQANNLPAATAEFEKLVEKQPKSITNHTAVGMLYDAQRKTDQAKAAYERALAIDPRAPVAANNLAQIYVDRNQNLEVALQLAQTAKAGLPKSPEVDDTLGWIYYKKGNAPLAVASLKQAAAAQPDNALFLYHLGAAYALNKDQVNAAEALKKALKLQPGLPEAEDARRILATLKG
jgi:Flp pilus assembly protein TadD